MAIPLPKRKQRLSKKTLHGDHESSLFCYLFEKILCRVPLAMLFLAFIYVWSSSATLFSGNAVHVCVSSRKLNNLYCLSAGTQPDIKIPVSLANHTSSKVNDRESDNGFASFDPKIDDVSTLDDSHTSRFDRGAKEDTSPANMEQKVGNQTLEDAYKEVEDQLQIHRSWISNSDHTTCQGKGIYIYELPSKFNKDLLAQCMEMIPWANFCRFLTNKGLGEPIPNLGPGWHHTHQYSLEPIFHARILNHPCRVYDHRMAKLFYVPYYGGLDILRWHFKNVSVNIKDSLALDLMEWLASQEAWNGNRGKDHVFVLGKISWDFRRKEGSSWGTRLLELDEMQNPVKLLIERQPWHVNDVGIPHPTYFHPRTDNDIITWQLKVIKSRRESLVGFAGAARPSSSDNIRSVLIEQCLSEGGGKCRFLNCTSGECDRPDSIIGHFMESEFCLQPPGDSPTRKSVFDSLVSGCVPVVFDPFTAYYQYPWHFPEDREKYSVFVDKDEVRERRVNVVERLMKVPLRERENMRRYIVFELLPGLVYGDLDAKFDKFEDAFMISVNNLLERVSRLG